MEEKDKPLVSIITVCLNSEKTIEQTIQSVINQTYPNIEYIMIDGKSTDRTLDIIAKYRDKISILVSERDPGIYDAMNKGLKISKGDIINFLNAGDYLYNSSIIERIVSLFTKDNSLEMVYGDAIYYDETNKKDFYASFHIPNRYILFIRGICHQSIFTKKSAFDKFGNFNLKYSIYADHDWLLRVLLKHRIKSYYYNIPVSFYLMGGISENCDKYAYELEDIIKQYKGTNLILIRYRLLRCLSKYTHRNNLFLRAIKIFKPLYIRLFR
jgi:glycosyltransferase involved in cell wall biosynthesis